MRRLQIKLGEAVTPFAEIWLIIFFSDTCNQQLKCHVILRDDHVSRRAAGVIHTLRNLTLCVPCIILQCVNDQRDAQFL